MEQPLSEEENNSSGTFETAPGPAEKTAAPQEQSESPPENMALAEEMSIPSPGKPPLTKTPAPNISVEQNGDIHEKELGPNHRRGTTIDFHDLSSVKPEKIHRSQSISTMRRSLDGLSEEREITEFPNGSDGKPIRIRVRVNGGHERQVSSRGFVETQTGLESVKSVISKFGGSVDWRFQGSNTPRNSQNQQGNVDRMAMLEVDNVRREVAQYKMKSETIEASTAELLKELEHMKRHMNRLKTKLAVAEAEESKLKEELNRANHYLEIADIFAREGGKSDQIDKVKTQQETAVSELNSVKEEIKSLKVECETLAKEKENLVAKAEEAILASKNAEKVVEELTEELANVRKLLEIATVAKQEADEHKLKASLAKDEECLMWKKEIREAEEELLQISMQVASAKELEEKLEAATGLLEKLNVELELYMKKLNPGNSEVDNEEYRKKQDMLDSKAKEIEEVKAQIEKVQGEIDVLRVEVLYLKTEIEKERIELADLKQKVELALVEIPSVKTEIEKAKEQTNSCMEKEKEAKRKLDELPSLIEEVMLEVKQSKSIAQDAEDELNKVKLDAEPALVTLKTIKLKINAASKEIEASKMAENIASAAIKALQETEADGSSEKVTISFEEYFSLSKQGHEAAEQAQERLNAVIAQIENAKASESNSCAILRKTYNELDAKKKVLHETERQTISASLRKLDAEQELKHLKEKSEQECNNVELDENEVSKPADDDEVAAPDVATNGENKPDEDNKEEVKIDDAVNGVSTTDEPSSEVLRRSTLDDSFDKSNVCCLSGRRSNFLSDEEAVAECQFPVDSPTVSAGKKKTNLFRKFWTKRKAKSVAG